jgi:hypothetical protein
MSKYLHQSCGPKPMTRIDINDNNQSSNRLPDNSKETKDRMENNGQHKIGKGGYGKLKSRIVRIK